MWYGLDLRRALSFYINTINDVLLAVQSALFADTRGHTKLTDAAELQKVPAKMKGMDEAGQVPPPLQLMAMMIPETW